MKKGDVVTRSVPFQGIGGGDGTESEEEDDLATPILRVVTLNGGIQIPLYVILLALIGGAINMTRQVPDFQSRQPVQSSLLRHMPWASHGSAPVPGEHDEEEKENLPWRKGLLEQYMFLVAAPFLAIATYYLLILLGAIQPPIIVLVCFSIGLISDTVVTALTEAAKKLLGGRPVKEEAVSQQPSRAQTEPKPDDSAQSLVTITEVAEEVEPKAA